MNNSFLIRDPLAILTGQQGDAARAHGSIRVRDGRITAIGPLAAEPGEQVFDARDCVVYPGWVNTHHHLFQVLLKGIPAGINEPLIQWLSAVPVRYRKFVSDANLRLGAKIGIAELLLSGCTTVADHQYAYWPEMPFDASALMFEVAEEMGVRFALLRGGATRARQFDHEPPPQARPETLDGIIRAVEHDAARFHQREPFAMRKVVMAPTTPMWSVDPDDLPHFARAARRLGLRLHSHLSETADYVRYCREVYGCLPVEYVERHEWLGPDVWFAHMVHVSEAEIPLLARSGTGVAHCPQSNCRLGSGIAPVMEFDRAGVPVSLAVDGTASNEAGDMINEAHVCWFAQRARGGAHAATIEDVVRWGTSGGAAVMGFDGVGTIRAGAAADLVVYSMDELRYAGLHDPAIGPVASGGAKVRYAFCDGRLVVKDGEIPGLDVPALLAAARQAVAAMQ